MRTFNPALERGGVLDNCNSEQTLSASLRRLRRAFPGDLARVSISVDSVVRGTIWCFSPPTDSR